MALGGTAASSSTRHRVPGVEAAERSVAGEREDESGGVAVLHCRTTQHRHGIGLSWLVERFTAQTALQQSGSDRKRPPARFCDLAVQACRAPGADNRTRPCCGQRRCSPIALKNGSGSGSTSPPAQPSALELERCLQLAAAPERAPTRARELRCYLRLAARSGGLSVGPRSILCGAAGLGPPQLQSVVVGLPPAPALQRRRRSSQRQPPSGASAAAGGAASGRSCAWEASGGKSGTSGGSRSCAGGGGGVVAR